ncbi:uncharacterized protein SOCE26_048980 [Sorangium cellulosum]|uniref:Uncharacterized protein n=1 Tax=Sorangium cellulosum TaxID=56 RepID=A0A2L0EVW8_SORCE|nr:uncharacterized protein SOCE26_048980 [Sorangium cellulosum]
MLLAWTRATLNDIRGVCAMVKMAASICRIKSLHLLMLFHEFYKRGIER